jgi:hypothetical protein
MTLTNVPPIDKRVRACLLVLAPGEHEHGFFLLAVVVVVKSTVRVLQAFIIVAVVLVFQRPEKRGRAGKEVAGFAGVSKGDVATEEVRGLCRARVSGEWEFLELIVEVKESRGKMCCAYLADELGSSAEVVHEVDPAVAVASCIIVSVSMGDCHRHPGCQGSSSMSG